MSYCEPPAASDRLKAIVQLAYRARYTFDDIIGTSDDIRKVIPDPYYGPAFHDQPILAIDKVRFVGEPVAVVVARDRYLAEDAAEMVGVTYEPLAYYINDPKSADAPHFELQLGVVEGSVLGIEDVSEEIDAFAAFVHGFRSRDLHLLDVARLRQPAHQVADEDAGGSVDRLAILDAGRVIAEGTPAALKSRLGSALRLELVLDADAAAVPGSPFGLSAVRVGNRLMVAVPTEDAGQAVQWAESLQRSNVVDEYTLGPSTLEDVYIALVEGTNGQVELEEVLDASAA